MSTTNLQTIFLKPTKFIPNSTYPLLYYASAFHRNVTAGEIQARFSENKWIPQWQYGMYKRSYYHSTTHEALGVFKGEAKLRFGVSDAEVADDSNSVTLSVSVGDVLVIPSGVAHRALEDSGGFQMVGAYPEGAKEWDMNYGGEHHGVEKSIPSLDPVNGTSKDGLLGLWKPQ